MKPLNFSNKKNRDLKQAAQVLQAGGVGVLPTDTLYGLVGQALNKKAVEKVYRLRKRNKKKPLIILISKLADLQLFSVKPNPATVKKLLELWPGKISIILNCPSQKHEYLHRGARSLAFRIPASKVLRNMIEQAGPLVAPSANWEGSKPALTISEAKKYFGTKVDFYFNAGKKVSAPSTLIKIEKGKIELLRKGAVRI